MLSDASDLVVDQKPVSSQKCMRPAHDQRMMMHFDTKKLFAN